MPYCGHCGSVVSPTDKTCSHCGRAIDPPPSYWQTIQQAPPPPYQPYRQTPLPPPSFPPPVYPDTPNTGLNILAFLIPLAGAILYLLKYRQYPVQAKALGTWAIIGYAFWMVLGWVLWVFFVVLMSLL